MFFRTPDECRALARGFGWDDEALEALRSPDTTAPHPPALSFGHALADSFRLAHAIARELGEFPGCVLWVREYGIWPSLDNRHLYYRVRQSYGDRRSLADAPGHEFVDHEYADLVLFLELVIRMGWGAAVFSSRPLPACFVSHDGWVRFSGPDADAAVRELQASELFVLREPATGADTPAPSPADA